MNHQYQLSHFHNIQVIYHHTQMMNIIHSYSWVKDKCLRFSRLNLLRPCHHLILLSCRHFNLPHWFAGDIWWYHFCCTETAITARWTHGPLARYVILRLAHALRMLETFPQPSRVSDPDMHHGTCMAQAPWCMPGLLTSGCLWSWWQGKTFLAFMMHAQPAIIPIW